MASSPIQLRSYRPADFETLYRIDQLCFPRGIAYGRFELKVYLRSDVSQCLIADASREIAGFILTELAVGEGHIITLDVLGSYRRKGIGSLLLAEAEKELASRGGKHIVLETATTNNAAIALWAKHGYRQIVTIEEYYARGLMPSRCARILLLRETRAQVNDTVIYFRVNQLPGVPVPKCFYNVIVQLADYLREET